MTSVLVSLLRRFTYTYLALLPNVPWNLYLCWVKWFLIYSYIIMDILQLYMAILNVIDLTFSRLIKRRQKMWLNCLILGSSWTLIDLYILILGDLVVSAKTLLHSKFAQKLTVRATRWRYIHPWFLVAHCVGAYHRLLTIFFKGLFSKSPDLLEIVALHWSLRWRIPWYVLLVAHWILKLRVWARLLARVWVQLILREFSIMLLVKSLNLSVYFFVLGRLLRSFRRFGVCSLTHYCLKLWSIAINLLYCL